MEAIKKFKEQAGKLTGLLEEVKKGIRQTTALIDALASAPLPPADMPATLALMVDAAAARYVEFLHSESGIPEAFGASVTDLPCSIEEGNPLSHLFVDRSGWDEVSGRPVAGAIMRPDALCYFFGDLIKQKLVSACAAMERDPDDAEAIATPYAQRLADIKAAEAKLKALRLQEEELEAALDEARETFDSLGGL